MLNASFYNTLESINMSLLNGIKECEGYEDTKIIGSVVTNEIDVVVYLKMKMGIIHQKEVCYQEYAKDVTLILEKFCI